jgi:hypothetical protein
LDQNQSVRIAVYFACAGLLGGPALAIVTFIWMRRHYSQLLSSIAIGSAILLLLAMGLALSGFSFTSIAANYACFAVLYTAYAFLVVSCLRIKNKVIRMLALVMSAAPMCIGFPIPFLDILESSDIEHIERLAPNLTCRITGWGMAGGSSGYRVDLYKSWSSVPFLERRVLGDSVVQAGYSGAPPDDVSCTDLLMQFEKSRASGSP